MGSRLVQRTDAMSRHVHRSGPVSRAVLSADRRPPRAWSRSWGMCVNGGPSTIPLSHRTEELASPRRLPYGGRE